ncbi:hypothetical protein [Brevibacillus massiliensis]|uniref:hypothetical protein n=1 Tax=Brevibacillus massiliensis TaxID=1118054 RepID=UPI0002E91264|nr:hypothetical protein [Brevibacillus massiliensis]
MDVSYLERELEDIQKRKKKWQMAFANDVISLDDLKQRMQEENEREETIRQQLMAGPLLDKQQAKLSPNEVMEVAKSLKENWSFLEPNHKKLIMQTLFSEIIVDVTGESIGGPGRRVPAEIISLKTN